MASGFRPDMRPPLDILAPLCVNGGLCRLPGDTTRGWIAALLHHRSEPLARLCVVSLNEWKEPFRTVDYTGTTFVLKLPGEPLEAAQS